MSRQGANVAGNPAKPRARRIRSAEAANKAASVIEAGLPAVQQATDERHRKAVTEALAKNALTHMLEHRGTALRLRNLLNRNLSDVEAMITAIPDPGALGGALGNLTPDVRQQVFNAIGMPGRLSAVDHLIGTFAKLVAVDKELLGLPDVPAETPADVEQRSTAFTPDELARIARIKAKFADMDVTDVTPKEPGK